MIQWSLDFNCLSRDNFSNGMGVAPLSVATSFSKTGLKHSRRRLQIMMANIKVPKGWKFVVVWKRTVENKLYLLSTLGQSIAYINVKLVSHFPNQVANFGIKISSIVDNINNGMSNLKIVKVQIF